MPTNQPFELRPKVRAFAELMEERLRENDHKGGWQQEHLVWLHRRLNDESYELGKEVYKIDRDRDSGKISREAADVANFAMMIADNAGSLGESDAD